MVCMRLRLRVHVGGVFLIRPASNKSKKKEQVPTTRMVKSKPFLIDRLWTWLGKLAKPTYPFNLRFATEGVDVGPPGPAAEAADASSMLLCAGLLLIDFVEDRSTLRARSIHLFASSVSHEDPLFCSQMYRFDMKRINQPFNCCARVY